MRELASGHGRFTRHLARAIGAQRVTVSEVAGVVAPGGVLVFSTHGAEAGRLAY